MAELMMGNVDPEASDEEIRDFLVKYGFPEFDGITHLDGDGSRPAVLVSFSGHSAPALHMLQERIQNMFWKNRRLHVQVVSEHRL